GNYECACWKGYVPAAQGDASKCIKGCVPGQNCIHGDCVTGAGGTPICRCKPGFRGSSCEEDINECLEKEGRGLCQQICTNTFGSFRCSCRPGYVLQSDGASCLKQSESEFGDVVRPSERDACKEKKPCEQLCFNTRVSLFSSSRTFVIMHIVFILMQSVVLRSSINYMDAGINLLNHNALYRVGIPFHRRDHCGSVLAKEQRPIQSEVFTA
ncbi:unnamed protein product, partial [Dibothriocephalus latus]